tara:strand:- start:2156 stop:2323 length:168 start_codon:yes stop_codon:yes gene_type:complete
MNNIKIKIGLIRPQILLSISGLILISLISIYVDMPEIATGGVAGIIALSKDLLNE